MSAAIGWGRLFSTSSSTSSSDFGFASTDAGAKVQTLPSSPNRVQLPIRSAGPSQPESHQLALRSVAPRRDLPVVRGGYPPLPSPAPSDCKYATWIVANQPGTIICSGRPGVDSCQVRPGIPARLALPAPPLLPTCGC